MVASFVRALVSAFKTHRDLAFENLTLQQQLSVFRRSLKSPRVSDFDRGFCSLIQDLEGLEAVAGPRETGDSYPVAALQGSDAIGHGRAGGVDPVDPPSLPSYAP